MFVVLIGPASSIGSPITFMMRPSVPGPTGTRIGAPVSITSWPRTRPSVVSMAMVRTVFSPRCWATSSTSRLAVIVGLQRVQDRRQLAVELDVDDGADDLGDAAQFAGDQWHSSRYFLRDRIKRRVSVTGMLPRVALE